MNKNFNKIIKAVIKLSVTIGLLMFVFSRIESKEFAISIKSARWEYLAGVWFFTVIYFWIRSAKLHLILKRQQCNIRVRTVFGASAVTSLYGLMLPEPFSTSVKWYILKKETGQGTQVFSSMIYNQFTEIIVMIIFGLSALIVSGPAELFTGNNQYLFSVICGVMVITLSLFYCLLLSNKTAGVVTRLAEIILRFLPDKLQKKGKEILQQITAFQNSGCWFHLKIILITIISTIVGGVVIYILSAKGANIAVPIEVFIWLPAIIYILGRIPISIANLGVREVTIVGLLIVYGVEESSALLMSMIVFSTIVLMAVIGAGWQLAWTIKKEGNDQSNCIFQNQKRQLNAKRA